MPASELVPEQVPPALAAAVSWAIPYRNSVPVEPVIPAGIRCTVDGKSW
jgi:hypothetical protein